MKILATGYSISTLPKSSGSYRKLFGVACFIIAGCILWSIFTVSVFAASRYGAPLQFDDPPVDLGQGYKQQEIIASPPITYGKPIGNSPSSQAAKNETLPFEVSHEKSSDAVLGVVAKSIAVDSAASTGEEPATSLPEDAPKNAKEEAITSSAVATKQEKPPDTPENAVKVVRLFNTVDLFRKPIAGNAPQWERVVNSEKKKRVFWFGCFRADAGQCV